VWVPTGIRTQAESSTNSSANHYTIGTMVIVVTSQGEIAITQLYQKNAYKSRLKRIDYLQTGPVIGAVTISAFPVLSVQKIGIP
jgi:hypothetical protein